MSLLLRALALILALVFVVVLGAGVPGGTAKAQEPVGLRLLVIEQAGCVYCAQFRREIEPAYNASPESVVAPLVYANIRGPWPEGVALSPPPFVTPTFVLIDATGQERGRITGYPGDIFFWSLLQEILISAQNTDGRSTAGG